MEQNLRRTPLNAWHIGRGAKMVPFGGWEMPVQYSGIVNEHRSVRESAGVFDVSHMGEFEFSGPGAIDLLDRLTVSDIRSLEVGGVQYTLFLNSRGGTIDDAMLYRLEDDRFWAVVNASNIEKDWKHVSEVSEEYPEAQIQNLSDDLALLALQGPKAEAILSRLTQSDLSSLPFHHVREMNINSHKALVAASGYTGENGFEIFVPAKASEEVLASLLETGESDGLVPAGLGARDTLRLEASLALYGHELDEETSPLEARLDFCVAGKEGHIGAEAIVKLKEEGLPKRLVMLEMVDRGIPRQGYPVQMPDGKVVGEVTSGTFAPWLQKSIAMAFVPAKLTRFGREYLVDIRGKARRAIVVGRPFYKRPER